MAEKQLASIWYEQITLISLYVQSTPKCSKKLLSTNNNNDRFTALCPGLPGWAGTRRNIHPPTIL